MASFSPSPAPRRSSRINRPISPQRRARLAGSGPASRLATPLQNIEQRNDDASNASAMDVDETGSQFTAGGSPSTAKETLFTKSEELLVSFYADLPVEVKQVLRNTDLYKNPHTGAIDTLTGFATVASIQTCFVWQHAQAIKGTPTCYIFACPQDIDQIVPPLHALIPHGPSREPGLVLISPAGSIRLWDSIGIGLAGGNNFAASKIDLNIARGERINNLVRADEQTFIASTDGGNCYGLTITSIGGKYHLSSKVFPLVDLSKQSRFFMFRAPPRKVDPLKSIYSIALGEQTHVGRAVWISTSKDIKKWCMKPEGLEGPSEEFPLAELLNKELKEKYPAVHDFEVELLDMAIDSNEDITVLVSHFPTQDTVGISGRYCLARIRISGLNDFKVETLKTVPYQSTFTSGANIHARIQLLFGGSLICIRFGDAVALCARDSDYQDRFELKSDSDRVLGVGVTQDGSGLLVLTASTMMKINVDIDKIMSFNSETGGTSLIKSIMMQAILYGANHENPLKFSFPPEIDGESLMQAAQQLSQAVLESDPEVVRKNYDLTSQLTARKDRLSWLIHFINDNVALWKFSQTSRQQLATDSEKLYACRQLWIQYNELLSTNPQQTVLGECVQSFMDEIGDGPHEDVVRAFFRLRVGDIGAFLRKLTDPVKAAAGGSGIVDVLSEANRILLTVLRSALDYRAYNLAVYGIDLPMIKPWTSKAAIIDVGLTLFDATNKALDSSTRDNDVPKATLNGQLPDLAAILLECIEERLSWLGSPRATGEEGNASLKEALEQKLKILRPELLETLRQRGQEEAAFALAEKYHDFASLATLCSKGTLYPPENNPNMPRIQSYISKYKDSFTKELYQWYIQHGELRVMFSQEDQQAGYLDKFFAENPVDSISWIYDLGKPRYGSASSALLREARHSSNFEARHLMLSIGKLSHLAQLYETKTPTNESTAQLDAFHDELDFVSVHEALLQEFHSALEGVRGRHSLESQVDIILKAKASKLADRNALAQVFKDLLRHLLQGKALSIEDAVDLLTLKDNTNSIENYATALHLLARVPAEQLPYGRKSSAFRSVWRRIYIHDDWDSIRKTSNISDTELTVRYQHTALYSTLCAILPREDKPPGYETPPNEALEIPSPDEIASRWPGMSPDQVDSIIRDYNRECDILGELDIEDDYYRVRELAMEAVL